MMIWCHIIIHLGNQVLKENQKGKGEEVNLKLKIEWYFFWNSNHRVDSKEYFFFVRLNFRKKVWILYTYVALSEFGR